MMRNVRAVTAGSSRALAGLARRFIRYVTDVNASLPVSIADGTRKYVWGQGLAYNVAGTSIEVYHADRLGSVRLITDGTGAVTGTSRFDEWGIVTAAAGSSTQPFRFTGEPTDARVSPTCGPTTTTRPSGGS